MLVMFYLLNLHYWDQSRKMGSYAQFLYIVQPRCMRQKASPYDQAMVESTASTNLLYLPMLNSFFSFYSVDFGAKMIFTIKMKLLLASSANVFLCAVHFVDLTLYTMST